MPDSRYGLPHSSTPSNEILQRLEISIVEISVRGAEMVRRIALAVPYVNCVRPTSLRNLAHSSVVRSVAIAGNHSSLLGFSTELKSFSRKPSIRYLSKKEYTSVYLCLQ